MTDTAEIQEGYEEHGFDPGDKPKPVLDLVGLDGNAFAVLGAWQQAARDADWTREEIKVVMDEAMSGDYYHLLAVIQDNSEGSM